MFFLPLHRKIQDLYEFQKLNCWKTQHLLLSCLFSAYVHIRYTCGSCPLDLTWCYEILLLPTRLHPKDLRRTQGNFAPWADPNSSNIILHSEGPTFKLSTFLVGRVGFDVSYFRVIWTGRRAWRMLIWIWHLSSLRSAWLKAAYISSEAEAPPSHRQAAIYVPLK